MILTRTPYRVSLFGGGTDYPEWFSEHGGCVLGMAINKYCYVGVKRMPPGQMHEGKPIKFRVQYSKVDDCHSAEEVKHPAVRAILKYFNVDVPLEFHIFGDLPGRSGLGGSSAFTVGLLNAVTSHLKIPVEDLAREAIPFEQFVVNETVGYQDQIFSAYGGLRFITFDAKGAKVETVQIHHDRLKQLMDSLILVYSGTMRDAHVMAKKQIERIPANHEILMRMKALAIEAKRVLENKNESLANIGHMLEWTWQLKRGIHSEISTPEIALLYERAMKCGAIGGKLLGAGGGGFMLFFVHPYLRDRFKRTIGAECVDFNIAWTGSTTMIGDNE